MSVFDAVVTWVAVIVVHSHTLQRINRQPNRQPCW